LLSVGILSASLNGLPESTFSANPYNKEARMSSKYGFETEEEKQLEHERSVAEIRAHERERASRLKPLWDRVAPLICDILEDFARARGWVKVKTAADPFMLEISVTGEVVPSRALRGVVPTESFKIVVRLSPGGNSLSTTHPYNWYRVYSGKDYLEKLLQVIADQTRLSVALQTHSKGCREGIPRLEFIKEFVPDG
jgi:hypothetical protein